MPPVPATWERSPTRTWNAPEIIKQFQRDNNIDYDFFKDYVKARVRDMQAKGHPRKLIEFLQAGTKVTEEEFRNFDNFIRYEMEDLVEDLIAHLEINLGILQQVAQIGT